MSGAATARKPRRKPSAERQQAIAARKAEIEQAAEDVQDDAPDFLAFLAGWGDRYNHNNLRRLWVQAPRATCLHKYGTWQGMGRQVRKGETAILLMQPRTSTDPDRATPDNPEGRIFHGASWMALFDYAQTDAIGEFTDQAAPDADPGLVAEVKRLRWRPPTPTRTAAATLRSSWPHGRGTRPPKRGLRAARGEQRHDRSAARRPRYRGRRAARDDLGP